MGLVGPGFQFRMELDAHEPGVFGQLHDLHQPLVGGEPGQHQPRLGKGLPVVVVELVAVAVALGDLVGAVGPVGKAVVAHHPAGIGAQTHGTSLGGDPPLVRH